MQDLAITQLTKTRSITTNALAVHTLTVKRNRLTHPP